MNDFLKMRYKHINEEFFDELNTELTNDEIEVEYQSTDISILLHCDRSISKDDIDDIDNQIYNDLCQTFESYISNDFNCILPFVKQHNVGDDTGAPVSLIRYNTSISSNLDTEVATNLILDIIDVVRELDSYVFKDEMLIYIYQSENNKVLKYYSTIDIYFDSEPDYGIDNEFINAIKCLSGNKFDINKMRDIITEREV